MFTEQSPNTSLISTLTKIADTNSFCASFGVAKKVSDDFWMGFMTLRTLFQSQGTF